MPYTLFYQAHKPVDEISSAWHVVNAEYYYFLAAEWAHTLLTDKVFAWLDATVWGKPPVRGDTAPRMSRGRVVTSHVAPP